MKKKGRHGFRNAGCLKVPARSGVPPDLAHRLIRAIAGRLASLCVYGAARHRRTVGVAGVHFDIREAVVLAVNGREEVHDERGDVEDVDEGDGPFENSGLVVLFLVGEGAEG